MKEFQCEVSCFETLTVLKDPQGWVELLLRDQDEDVALGSVCLGRSQVKNLIEALVELVDDLPEVS